MLLLCAAEILSTMFFSGGLSCLVGFLAGLPITLVFVLTTLYFLCVMGDSAALTAGLVAAADPGRKGASMALHSLFGFGAGFVAPLAFGLVIDLAEGRADLRLGIGFRLPRHLVAAECGL